MSAETSTIKRGSALVIYYSSSAVCGVGTWVEALAQELEARDWSVVVGLAWGRRFHDPLRVERKRPSLKTIWMDGRTGTEEGRIQAVARTIRRVRPDVVILTCLDSAFEAVRRLRRNGAAFHLIATNHGNLPRQAACLMGQQDVVDMAVCVGQLSCLAMTGGENGFPPSRIRHVGNPVPLPDAVRVPHSPPFRVGYAGRLDGELRKRVDDLEPFFRELLVRWPCAELWIAGDGMEEHKVRAMGDRFRGRVTCFGGMTRAELYKRFYPQLDALINCSASEGWGLSIAEAMAHGVVPVSAAFDGVYTEGLIREGINGLLFPVGDTAAAARTVAALFADPPRLARLGAQAAHDVRTRYSPARFGDQWCEVLRDCLALPPLPPVARPASLSCRSRFGIPEPQWERIRRLLRRRVPHASTGEEWPHYRCANTELINEVAGKMKAIEDQARSGDVK